MSHLLMRTDTGSWKMKRRCVAPSNPTSPLMLRARMANRALATERHGIQVVVLVSLEERLDASRGDQANVVPVWLNLARDVIRASGPLPRWAPHCCVERRSASSGQV